jgi:hypothetical protein
MDLHLERRTDSPLVEYAWLDIKDNVNSLSDWQVAQKQTKNFVQLAY